MTKFGEGVRNGRRRIVAVTNLPFSTKDRYTMTENTGFTLRQPMSTTNGQARKFRRKSGLGCAT